VIIHFISMTLDSGNTFGRFIAERRKSLGFSQKELAARIKKEDGTPISPQYLNDIEHDRRNPPPDYLLVQFADALNLARDELFFRAGQLPSDLQLEQYPPEKLRDALKAFRRRLER